MSKEKLNEITERISFLLEKQEDVRKITKDFFDGLTNFVDDKFKTMEDAKDKESLKSLLDNISKYNEESLSDVEEDIKFLKEQLGAIDQLKAIETEDPDKAKELMDMMLSEDEQLPNFDEFKKEIASQNEGYANQIKEVFEEIKTLIGEDKVSEAVLFLDAFLDSTQECDEDDCQSCQGCSEHEECDQDNCSGVDIFKDVK